MESANRFHAARFGAHCCIFLIFTIGTASCSEHDGQIHEIPLRSNCNHVAIVPGTSPFDVQTNRSAVTPAAIIDAANAFEFHLPYDIDAVAFGGAVDDCDFRYDVAGRDYGAPPEAGNKSWVIPGKDVLVGVIYNSQLDNITPHDLESCILSSDPLPVHDSGRFIRYCEYIALPMDERQSGEYLSLRPGDILVVSTPVQSKVAGAGTGLPSQREMFAYQVDYLPIGDAHRLNGSPSIRYYNLVLLRGIRYCPLTSPP